MVDTKKSRNAKSCTVHPSDCDDLRGAVDGWIGELRSWYDVLPLYFENIASYINQGEIDAGNPDFRYEDMSDAEAEQARKAGTGKRVLHSAQ